MEVVFVAQGNNVAQQGFFVRQACPFQADVDASPVGLSRDFAIALEQMARHPHFSRFPAHAFAQQRRTLLIYRAGNLLRFHVLLHHPVILKIEWERG